MRSFVTGSRVYGHPREDSDVDMVICCTYNDIVLLRTLADDSNHYENGGTVTFGRLNIIYFNVEEPYEMTRYHRWLRIHKELARIAPVTKDFAILAFRHGGVERAQRLAPRDSERAMRGEANPVDRAREAVRGGIGEIARSTWQNIIRSNPITGGRTISEPIEMDPEPAETGLQQLISDGRMTVAPTAYPTAYQYRWQNHTSTGTVGGIQRADYAVARERQYNLLMDAFTDGNPVTQAVMPTIAEPPQMIETPAEAYARSRGDVVNNHRYVMAGEELRTEQLETHHSEELANSIDEYLAQQRRRR